MTCVKMRSKYRGRYARQVLGGIGLSCLVTLAASEQVISPDSQDVDALFSMSLEELLSIPVEIATRTPKTLAEVPAAVTVITGEDIRRSGATSIAEALRMAPGMDAAQINNNSWAVGLRGFNSYLANKSLVMMDGRSVYAPLFAGTYWDSVDTVLNDIERIEINRGPGAAVWGANTMNGVVNILTKSAKDTQGTLFKAGYGSELQGQVAVRHGFKAAENVHMRVYGKYLNQEESILQNNQDAFDALESGRGGLRLDWEPRETTTVTFQSDLYSLREHNTFIAKPTGGLGVMPVQDLMLIRGGNVLGRINHELESGVTMSLQGYYDRSDRDTFLVHDVQNVSDFEFTLSGPNDQRHHLSGGLGYRMTADSISTPRSDSLSYMLPHRTTRLYSAFVQDSVSLVPEKLDLTLGSKFEHNSYTGFEFQPGMRLGYHAAENHMFWGSVTRSIRTPSRTDLDVIVDPGAPVPLFFVGDRNSEAETMFAYELGYRGNLKSNLSLDAALFYNDYDRLITSGIPTPAATGLVAGFENGMEGKTHGVEISPHYQVLDWWHLTAAYTIQSGDFSMPAGFMSPAPSEAPRHILNLQSRMDLSDSVELDLIGRFVSERYIQMNNFALVEIPAYWALDMRIGWRPKPNLELSLVGKNLTSPSNCEFLEPYALIQSTEIQRSVFGTVTWSF